MFGDDPDTTVATVRVGFGTTFGRALEGGRCTVQGGVRWLGGVCWARLEWKWVVKREEKESSPATVSGDRKRPTFDRLYCRDNYSLGRQTDSECDEIWQAAYWQHNNTACQLSTHSENIFPATYKIIFRTCRGRVQVCLGSERTMEGTGRPRLMQVLKT